MLSSDTGMPVAGLLRLHEDEKRELYVVVRWKGLSAKDDTMERTGRVHEELPELLMKLINRKITSQKLRDKAHAVLGL